MARDLNKVMLTGRLGKDVELRVTPSGSAVATFSVASGRSVKQSDGSYQDQTEWFRVVAWEKLAETCSNFLKKGSHVYIEGRVQTRKYMDKNNQEQTIVEVIANEMLMLESKRGQEEGGGSYQQAGNNYSNGNGKAAPARSAAPSRNSNPFEEDEMQEPEDIPF